MAATDHGLPVVDLAPFFAGAGEGARTLATEAVIEACRAYGFFRVVNHGVPQELVSRSLELSAAFFALPDREKDKVRPLPAAVEATPLPAGYTRLPSYSPDRNEYLVTFQPHLGHNLYPSEPQELREALEECHAKLAQLGHLVQDILTQGTGLPLREYTAGDNSFHFLLRCTTSLSTTSLLGRYSWAWPALKTLATTTNAMERPQEGTAGNWTDWTAASAEAGLACVACEGLCSSSSSLDPLLLLTPSSRIHGL